MKTCGTVRARYVYCYLLQVEVLPVASSGRPLQVLRERAREGGSYLRAAWDGEPAPSLTYRKARPPYTEITELRACMTAESHEGGFIGLVGDVLFGGNRGSSLLIGSGLRKNIFGPNTIWV